MVARVILDGCTATQMLHQPAKRLQGRETRDAAQFNALRPVDVSLKKGAIANHSDPTLGSGRARVALTLAKSQCIWSVLAKLHQIPKLLNPEHRRVIRKCQQGTNRRQADMLFLLMPQTERSPIQRKDSP